MFNTNIIPRLAKYILIRFSKPEVGDPADEVHCAVPGGDQSVLGEEDGLRPHGRLGELGKHDARHAGLEHRHVRLLCDTRLET